MARAIIIHRYQLIGRAEQNLEATAATAKYLCDYGQLWLLACGRISTNGPSLSLPLTLVGTISDADMFG